MFDVGMSIISNLGLIDFAQKPSECHDATHGVKAAGRVVFMVRKWVSEEFHQGTPLQGAVETINNDWQC